MTRLAQLILENVHIDRWVFKINGETEGRGLAFIDLNAIKAFKSFKSRMFKAKKEKESEPSSTGMSSTPVVDWYPRLTTLLLKKLPSNLQIVRRKMYEGFEDYVEKFCEKGGMIEASPCIV